MTKTKNFVFDGLHILSWIIFIGLCIDAGALLVNFFISIFKPALIPHLYQKLDLSTSYSQSKWTFYGMYSFLLSIGIMKAYLFYIVVKLLLKLDLSHPFSPFVSKQITQLSYVSFSIGILIFIAKKTTQNLEHHGYIMSDLHSFWSDGPAFILMAAIIYIIAVIFHRGIEIQNENELTI